MGAQHQIRTGRLTTVDTEIEVPRLAATSLRWSSVAIAVFDAAGNPADPDDVTGTVTGSVLKTGQGKKQPFANVINLATDSWSTDAELATVRSFFFTVAGLNSGYSFEITINSWN